jgi:ectoine hydroxylase-related dioxygenase (phytanoyl-CoA dioxygenase family)
MITLSQEQINDYRTQGYFILRAHEHELVTKQELKTWTNEVANWPSEREKWMPYNEINANGDMQLMRTEKFADYHDDFGNLLFGHQLVSILTQLSGEEMLLFKDKINYKSPKGNGFHAHLDAPAYDHICKIEHVTANFAIDAATVKNGCLEVVPGSHRMNVELAEGGRISDAWVARHQWISIPLNPGDILFFGSHLAHKSGPNNSDDRRASLYATFSAKADGQGLREKYYAHRRRAFPPDHEREEEKSYEEGWKTYGFAAPFSREGIAMSTKPILV